MRGCLTLACLRTGLVSACHCQQAAAGPAGWTHLHNKHCFAHRLPSAARPAKHASLALAQSECRDDPQCSGVYKPLGLSDGGAGAYFLCDQSPVGDSAEGGQVWTAPRRDHVGVRKPGQAHPA